MLPLRGKFPGVGVRDAAHMPGKLDDGDLHAQADAEVGHVVFTAVLRGGDHALDAPVPETAGHQDAVASLKDLSHVLRGDLLAVDPADLHFRGVGVARVVQRFRHGEVGVVEPDVFSHQADGDLLLQMLDAVDHLFPLPEIRFAGVQSQLPADDAGKAALLQHERRLIQIRQGAVFDDAVLLDVAEQGDLPEDLLLQRFVAPQYDDVRGDAHALQFLDGVLCGLRLVLIAAVEEGHQCHVDVQGVLPSHFQAHLTGRLQIGLALDIAGGAADLRDDHVRAGLLPHPVDELLDLVGDVGDDLDRLAEILAPPLLAQHVPVHLAGGEVGEPVEVLIDEPFVVSQIQVRLQTVLGDVDFPVLIGAHGAGIHVDIRIQLLCRHLQAPGLQQTSQGRGGDALAQSGHHAAGDKDIFRHSACLLRCIEFHTFVREAMTQKSASRCL